MREVVAELAEHADFVFFDSPPLLAVTDAMLVGSLVDGVLVVVDSTRTRRHEVTIAVQMVLRAKPDMVGFVLNKVGAREAGYGSYYRYYGGDDGAERDGSRWRFIPRFPSRLRLWKSRAPKSTDGQAH